MQLEILKRYPENVSFTEKQNHCGVEENFAVGDCRKKFERFSHVIRLDIHRAHVAVRDSGFASRHR